MQRTGPYDGAERPGQGEAAGVLEDGDMSQVRWHMLVVPVTQGFEAGGSHYLCLSQGKKKKVDLHIENVQATVQHMHLCPSGAGVRGGLLQKV